MIKCALQYKYNNILNLYNSQISALPLSTNQPFDMHFFHILSAGNNFSAITGHLTMIMELEEVTTCTHQSLRTIWERKLLSMQELFILIL